MRVIFLCSYIEDKSLSDNDMNVNEVTVYPMR